MATGSGREQRAGSAEPARERRVPDELWRVRELLKLLELRQQRLLSRIAACEELIVAMAAQRPGPAGGTEP